MATLRHPHACLSYSGASSSIGSSSVLLAKEKQLWLNQQLRLYADDLIFLINLIYRQKSKNVSHNILIQLHLPDLDKKTAVKSSVTLICR